MNTFHETGTLPLIKVLLYVNYSDLQGHVVAEEQLRIPEEWLEGIQNTDNSSLSQTSKGALTLNDKIESYVEVTGPDGLQAQV